MDAMPVTALLATASGLQGPWAWMAGLGLGCILLFSLCAWFAWQSPPARGGPKAALVFLVFVLLGVGLPWGGQGIRLETSDGRSFELAELLDGFGVLCDALLLRVPAGLRVDPDASLLVLRAASLEPEALQLSYARWFEGEEAAPPRGDGPSRARARFGPRLRRAPALASRLLSAVRGPLDGGRQAPAQPW